MMELEMPSKVMDRKFIRMPEGDVVEDDEEWDRCGKWMLHHPQVDLKFLDFAWTKLQQLLADETLLMLKASTARMGEEGATILCFTRPGKGEAKRAARAIRGLVNFHGIMFYKLNKHTSEGVDNRFGYKCVSLFMQTFLGVFYTRKNGVWIQDIEDGAENAVSIASKFLSKNYSGRNGELPSTHKGQCFWNLPENHQSEQTRSANWYLFCSCEDDGAHLAEVDRVWLVAKELLEEGLFVRISVRKFANAQCAEVRLYVSQDCDVYSRLAACDRIFEDACCRTVMYFVEAGKIKPSHQKGINVILRDFEYTSGGELYRLTGYSFEYVFL